MCRVCDRRWTGTTQAHCTACHEHFSNVGVFDLHWRGRGNDRLCVPPGTLTDRRGHNIAEEGQTALGNVWRRKDTRDRFSSLRK